MLVQGIHHVCIRCEKSEIEKVKEFYQGVLGMPVIRSWGEPELEGFMFDTGAGLVEVFTDAEGQLPQGSIRHFALKTDDVDGCVKAVREAGYPITVEPKDIVIPSQPDFRFVWLSVTDRWEKKLNSFRKNKTGASICRCVPEDPVREADGSGVRKTKGYRNIKYKFT